MANCEASVTLSEVSQTFLHPFENDLKWQPIRVSHVDGEETPPLFLNTIEQCLTPVRWCPLGLIISYDKREDVHVVAL